MLFHPSVCDCSKPGANMKRSTFLVIAGIFIAASGLMYLIHYLIFRDVYHIFFYLIGDLAFLPLEVFLVVIVIERILSRREKQAQFQKLNMVIGAFFSEAGNQLLCDLLPHINNRDSIKQHLAVSNGWTSHDFNSAMVFTKNISVEINCRDVDIDALKEFLVQKRQFLLRMLENPNLLEHDRFTDLLWAIFHLTEELEIRPSLADLPQKDSEHIAGDMKRAYSLLLAEWIYYVEHLKKNYPFLFSLVSRTHPFQDNPSPIIT
jgi:hypothetical protein